MKTFLKGLAWLMSLVLVAAVAYVGYVWFSYSRIGDNLPLPVDNRQSAQLPVGKQLGAMTMNIGFGAYTPEFSFFMDGGEHARAVSPASVERSTDGVRALIEQYDPELVLLQEVDEDSDRSHHIDQAARLTAALGDYASVFALNYHSAYLFYPFHEPIGKSKSGILTLSKYAVDASLRVSLPLEGGLLKLIDLDRCFSVSRLPVENGRYLTLINIHASAFTNDEVVRRAQVEALMNALEAARAQGDYVLCGGDFNHDLHDGKSSELFGFENPGHSWLSPMDESALPDGLGLVKSANAPTVRDTGAAYVPGETFVAIIDGFIASDDVIVKAVETIDAGFEHSDHNPVLLTFELT